jgi:hypothetical protein
MMSFRSTPIAVLLITIAAIAPSISQAESTAKAKEYDFVQTARDFEVAGDTLTLSGLDDRVTYMMERPGRDAGQISTEQFVKSWSAAKDTFTKDPPNASLSYIENGASKVAIVTLSEPGSTSKGMQYRVKVLLGTLPAKGSSATLFIDGGGLMQLVAYGSQD